MEKSENIILYPATVILVRWINGAEYKFAIDGYVDQDGETYYKAKEIQKIENLMKQTEKNVEEAKKAIMEDVKKEVAKEISKGIRP